MRLYARPEDPVIEGALLDQMLASGAPVLIQKGAFTPDQQAQALANHGFRWTKKVRKGRWQDIKNSDFTMSIKGPILEAFQKIFPRFE